MSLRDTLSGARKEAQEAGGLFTGDASEGEREDAGFARRSAARAKPARGAAGTVRVVSASDLKAGKSGKSPSEMTREERKAERVARRDVEDRRVTATNVLLKRQEEYRHAQRVWWVLLGVGFGLTVVSFILSRVVPITSENGYVLTIGAIVVLVISYALIIAAFIYDWRHVKPLRKAAEDEVARLSNKRVSAILIEDAQDRAEEASAKEACRAMRRAKHSSR